MTGFPCLVGTVKHDAGYRKIEIGFASLLLCRSLKSGSGLYGCTRAYRHMVASESPGVAMMEGVCHPSVLEALLSCCLTRDTSSRASKQRVKGFCIALLRHAALLISNRYRGFRSSLGGAWLFSDMMSFCFYWQRARLRPMAGAKDSELIPAHCHQCFMLARSLDLGTLLPVLPGFWLPQSRLQQGHQIMPEEVLSEGS